MYKFSKAVDRCYTTQLTLKSQGIHNSNTGFEDRFKNSIASLLQRKYIFFGLCLTSQPGGLVLPFPQEGSCEVIS